MSISINRISNIHFTGRNYSNQNNFSNNNPVSKVGEASLVAKATFLGGLVIGARLLFELLCDNDFLFEHAAKKASNIVEKNNKAMSTNKKFMLKIGAFAGIVVAAISGFALLYTLFNTPKIAYKSKLNAYKKGREMDVYIDANNAERELYTQLSEKAKYSDETEKQNLKEQYAKMKIAKNKVPDFVKIKI